MWEVESMPVLQTRNLEKRFGGLVAVDNLSFSAKKGEILGIIGPNGAGKTTVINLVAGLLPVTAGEILFKKEKITLLPAHRRNQKGIARTFQNVRPLEDLTALENIMIGSLFGQRKSLPEAREDAERICGLINLKDPHRFLDGLTVLDLKKMEIGRALASDPDLIFLDELMAGLNIDETQELLEVIKGLKARNLAVIVVEHIMRVVKELADRVLVLDGGRIIAEGRYEQVCLEKEVIAAYLGRGD